MTRYFFDTEFIEDGTTIDLISIGIATDDGREFYGELSPELVPWARASAWHETHIRPHLSGDAPYSRASLAVAIAEFVAAGAGRPEFWAYAGAYDWVALCQLYGRLLDRPKGWPIFVRDLKQLADDRPSAVLPKEDGTAHHALADARWNREVHVALSH